MIVRLATPDDLDEVFPLRYRVFVDEQGVPGELERDAQDADAIHVVAVEGRLIVGTCRLVSIPEGWRLGRMAVRVDRRADGVGRRIVEFVHAYARAANVQRIVLAAQVPVQGFYEKQGYIKRGDVFMEAGIPHIFMDREVT